ncbi:M23 family metallopeptidase [Candidatus Falkowbacteria bacterium]|jgi:murein DD-endopeptidase MepM/ murein hydrolase activator NlpD|nr:M23 family metallopeptidase [Candidatus Falkowbacteria bacterium]MBT4433161.1 M23 family metallopeptidase [Candidatus Falkowbacteria bacterium]
MKKYIYTISIFLIVAGFSFFNWYSNPGFDNDFNGSKEAISLLAHPAKADKVVEIEIKSGSTYGVLMKEADLDTSVAQDIYSTSQELYDLANIRVGRFIELIYDKETEECKGLDYEVNTEEKLYVRKDQDGEWQAEIKPIDYKTKIKVAEGKVQSSMYEAAINNNIDTRAIIELANAFQWSIDFAMDPRVGDKFKFVYEEKYLDGEYVMPGRVLAGKYINDGVNFEVYYFEESEDNKGYFDEQGNSVQKMFLKAPVSFKYISSGFTTGSRYVEAFNTATGHRAIDYAAKTGTPIRSVGDGTVAFAGWSSVGYGYLTKIRHNSTYSTNYAHQSKIAVRTGQKVKQGQIIGYVGSTGFSTGPHLHYEMVKNGAKINPLREILPPGKPIKQENKERFFKEIKKYQEMIR